MNNTKSQTIVYANYLGRGDFLLSTDQGSLGVVTLCARNSTGQIVPWRDEHIDSAINLRHVLAGATKELLGEQPDDLIISIPQGGAA
ncbi:hypothetical protein OH491_19390 [Termitidicoccus mucosus]|uniref:Uncharacterized protein n=1 Tax=Termitidicoccus mucosus TaxID=1184151 RepID=A0A178IH66_9BACT|nr:hypothetical protein AW736_09280 [Opitutaceae bacterium TSB47]